MYRRRYYWLYGALSVPGRLYVQYVPDICREEPVIYV